MNDKEYKHIVRIANIDLPGDKVIRFAMQKIKGIGVNLADAICAVSKVNKHARAGELSDQEISSINQSIANLAEHNVPSWMFNRKKDYETGRDLHIITGTLSFMQDNDLKRLKKIKSYRGIRHIKGLTVRGQRTRSNFRRNKGKVVGVKKKAAAPAAGKDKKEAKK
ncbi:MAG TPA: 30S ribosomal protein S13 [Candidatus Nanoarchaeia archaeon]|nr:30S ribosomal protein S13 [Candidatus Nanoarchaeia archaeon]